MSSKKIAGSTIADVLKASGFVADNAEVSSIIKAKAEEAENLRLMQEAVDAMSYNTNNGRRSRPAYSRK
jgi:hypothetical protein